MDEIMLELGHTENLSGTEYIRMGVRLYRPGVMICKEVYPAIAKAVGSTPARVERSMRHSIECAWERGSWEAQRRWFGYSVDPKVGRPKVGEYLARMARLCHED